MGFYSWLCSECGKSIRNAYTEDVEPVAVVHRDSSRSIEPAYEGYGTFAGVNFCIGNPKLVHVKCDTGKTWEELRFSEDCPLQGYWDE